MKNHLLILIMLFTFTAGCKKPSKDAIISNGNYSGIFKVNVPDVSTPKTYLIFISFENGKFNIVPDLTRKPIGGSGTYSINGNIASFVDKNFWTADFDWNLILSGEYTIEINGDNLTLTKRFEPDLDPKASQSLYTSNSYQYTLQRDN
ncbi:hypothetical protein DU508_12875 [Pedobacter chinensis]|uniref:Lipocalin-like domain-containing protein n=1 Tax=Pedobacter chinensis TaxID=2282421 RepID=A0A369Q2C8_9SPHI|nr:hypothetical protein [Pedobacter chinensis]RDC56478.1 hypothetical protein DU508_12875 [Pedobacter chinensis]